MPILVAAVAASLRAVPALRGAGLYGAIDYDGSVYYGAAAGLAHGLVPYRDFLLLHPPGIVLVLLPAAIVGRVLGDPEGLAVARSAFILLGVLNALLVGRLLRREGRGAALAGGLFYAVSFPAVFMERSVSLEAAATTCLLGALLLLVRVAPRPGANALLLAGSLLGVSASLKIWGVVVAAAVVAWTARALNVRSAALLAAGVAVGAGLVCGPFFLAAPRPMWRMVVLDQLGRPRSSGGFSVRGSEILGLSGPGAFPWQTCPSGVLVGGLLVASLALLLALTSRVGRLGVVLAVSCTVLLLLTPSWFAHYAGLVAAPDALVVGAAISTVATRYQRRRLGLLFAALVGVILIALLGVGLTRTFGYPLASRQIVAAAAASQGCVTSDDVTTLIEGDLMRRNFARGCALVVDLGGYSYDLPRRGTARPRSHNRRWQAYALQYLRSGDLTVISRFHRGSGFSAQTASVVSAWPSLAREHGFRVRRPT